MREKIWNAYMQLQTTLAYGTEPWTGYCETSLKLAAKTLSALHASGPTLIIGGGHPMELQTLRDVGLDPMYLLTAHALEAEAAQKWGIESLCGDMHDMPYPSGGMRVVFTSNVMEHVFAPYLALMECRRVAMPGAIGYHAIPEFEGPEHGVGEFHLHCLTEPVWRQLLTKTGWQVESTERVAREDGHVYQHFLCRAVDVPHPHRKALEAVEIARASE